MNLIEPYTKIRTKIDTEEVLKTIESVARTCYKSEDKITENSSSKLVQRLINLGHEAMLEFYDVTVLFVCDRGVSHEIVRHRIASYAQESTRYCNYSKGKFDNGLTFIKPLWLPNFTEESRSIFWNHLIEVESTYFKLLHEGWKPEQARSVLPNSLKTEINVKMNLREWRHFFNLRCSKAAHPQIRQLARPLLQEFYDKLPIIFEDLYTKFIKNGE